MSTASFYQATSCSLSICKYSAAVWRLRRKGSAAIKDVFQHEISTRSSASFTGNNDLLHNSIIPTDYFQKSLPRLPIPKLDDTCNRYIAALAPLVSPADLERTKKIVEEFRVGEGRVLQGLLVEKDKRNKHTSYVYDLWRNTFFLQDRRPLVPFQNAHQIVEKDPRREHMEQFIRATNFIVSSLRYMKTLRANVLEPVVFHLNPGKSDNRRYRRVMRLLPKSLACYGSYLYDAFPLDVSQFDNLFNAARIPRPEKDELSCDPTTRHLLILSKGNLFIFDPFDNNGNIRSGPEILAELRRIQCDESTPAEYPVGFLTAESREVWAKQRENLIKAGNAETLRLVESALFAVSLDDMDIEQTNDLLRWSLCGVAGNRWFDKSFTISFAKNGQTSVNFEHASSFGLTVACYLRETFNDTVKNPTITPDTKPSAATSSVRRLNFCLTDEVKSAVVEARTKFHSNTDTLSFGSWEDARCIKTFFRLKGVGIDAMLQLTYQMAYYKLSGGKTVSSYEACSTAAFRHGLLETIRPTTFATVKACDMFHATGSRRPSNSELRACLHECSKKHLQLTKEAKRGQGFDCHMLALKDLASRNGSKLPAIFEDPSYALINHELIIASSIAFDCLFLGGFGPTYHDNFAIAYGYTKVTGRGGWATFAPETACRQFADGVRESMNDILRILDHNGDNFYGA